MAQQISVRGRTARKMIKMANHMPFIGPKAQSGELRARLSERERLWECPEHLELSVIDMHLFKMELLRSKTGTERVGENNDRDVESNDNADNAFNNTGIKKGIIIQLHGGGYYGRLYKRNII